MGSDLRKTTAAEVPDFLSKFNKKDIILRNLKAKKDCFVLDFVRARTSLEAVTQPD